MIKSIKYVIGWFWLHGNLPPSNYIGSKPVSYISKLLPFMVDKDPQFIPANDI